MACGGSDSDVTGPDAGSLLGNRLVILSPPGDDIGLAYNSSIVLYVRYVDGLGQVLRDREVSFALAASRLGEDTAGATLSTTSARTSDAGMAQVELFTGAEEGRFRIAVTAANASTVHFFVSISQGGFAKLAIEPVHDGWRDDNDFDRVELRLYPSALVRCSSLDVEDPPASAFPARGLDGFGGVVEFQSLNAGQPHTLLAWAKRDTEIPLATACVDLAGEQILPSTLRIQLTVRDRDLIVPEVLALTSSFDLSPVAESLSRTGRTRAWETLACPDGPGQLLLDCVLDQITPDDPQDCVLADVSGIAAALLARRGTTDEDGCRADVDAQGQPSLEHLLSDAVARGGTFPTGPALAALGLAQRDTVTALALTSRLRFDGPGLATHQLGAVTVPMSAGDYRLDLRTTSRPAIASELEFVITGDRLSMLAHPFGLRYDQIARAAFIASGLDPAGLAEPPEALGQALTASVTSANEDQSGCDAVSELLCGESGEAPICLRDSCEAAIPVIDTALAAWLDGLRASDAALPAGLDLELTGTGPLRDDDGDLRVDGLGGTSPGQWSATLSARGAQRGGEIDIGGQF